MLRRLFCLVAALPLLALAQDPQPPQLVGRAWVLADVSSGQILAAERPDERFEPASLTKLMTAYVTFAALKERKLALGDQVSVSEKAWHAPGSRMFIEPKKPVAVDELIRGMIVQSGNDACIALAEAISGSEEAFVQSMNHEAQRLGLIHT
ncbi:MAG TPA: serine hydrolase, partial [Burkholderiales bacterium]|nr:serine hydrolase [Burkholderiales bacterium]